MNMDQIREMHQHKEHLMRHEGKHPANRKASYQDFQGDKMPIYSDDGKDYPVPSIEKQEHETSKVVQGT
jgi:hypothetical protein